MSLSSLNGRSKHALLWRILSLLFFEKIERKKNSKNFQKFQFLCLWVHILGVPARAHKLPYVVCNIFQSHQKRTSRTKVMRNQKLGPICAYLVLIFKGIFSTSFFYGFWAIFDKNGLWAQFSGGLRTRTRGVSAKCGDLAGQNLHLNRFHTKFLPQNVFAPSRHTLVH